MKLINILATGPSLGRYKPSEEITIGVNKIVMTHEVDHLVIVDVLASFPAPVISKIRTRPFKEFYTHLPNEWKGTVKKLNHIFLYNLRGGVDLDSDKYCYSISSPFVAVHLAYKLGATLIDIYGADYNDHPSFTDKDILKQIKTHFALMQRSLIQKGCSMRVTKESMLSEFLPLIPESRQY